MNKRIIALLLFVLTISSCLVNAQDVRGIDVSHHQKKIDWKSVAKENIHFVYIKATEGATYKDLMFDENMKGAMSAGLPVGAYHYFRMTSTPEDQFDNFKKAIGKYKFQLIPMIDVETSDNRTVFALRHNLDIFISLIEKEYGCKPMIYGTQRSYNTYCAPKYNKLHLYIGRYGSNPPEIWGLGTYTIWQYSEKGQVKGISKAVDMCVMNKKYSLDDIKMPK